MANAAQKLYLACAQTILLPDGGILYSSWNQPFHQPWLLQAHNAYLAAMAQSPHTLKRHTGDSVRTTALTYRYQANSCMVHNSLANSNLSGQSPDGRKLLARPQSVPMGCTAAPTYPTPANLVGLHIYKASCWHTYLPSMNTYFWVCSKFQSQM
jgi:hypothetical protein